MTSYSKERQSLKVNDKAARTVKIKGRDGGLVVIAHALNSKIQVRILLTSKYFPDLLCNERTENRCVRKRPGLAHLKTS